MRKWLNNFPLQGAVVFTSLALLASLFSSSVLAEPKTFGDTNAPVSAVVEAQPAAWQTGYNRKAISATQTEFHGRWVNYLASDGSWDAIDPSVSQVGDQFVMDKAPFTFRAPLRSTGEVEFEANNRYDVVADRVIAAAPVSSFTTALGVADVPGVLQDIDGDGKTESVVYAGAYPSLGADLVYTVSVGRQPTLLKLVRFNSTPAADVDVQFSVRTSETPTVEVATKKAVKAAIREDDDARAIAAKVLAENRSKLTKWDKQRRVNVRSQEIAFRSVLDDMRGFGWKAPRIWDSGKGVDRKAQDLAYTFEQVGDDFVLTKHIKADFFTGATLPVYADTTSTFFPDPNTETTSVDGEEAYATNVTWATVRDAATATGGNDTGVTITTYVRLNAGAYTISRGFLLFDSSSIPDTDEISAGTLSLFGVSKFDDDNDAQAYTTIAATSPASDTALATADYDQVKGSDGNFPLSGTATIQKQSNDLDISGQSTTAYNDFTLNATGLANISKTAITKFGVVEGHDVEDTPPDASGFTGFEYIAADTALTTTDPKLVVTHAAAAAAGDAHLYFKNAAAAATAVID